MATSQLRAATLATLAAGKAAPDPDEVEIEKRKAMAMVAYLDGWARLQIQKPLTVSHAQWRLAINDAVLFLDEWGSMALEFQWTAADIFDVPCADGATGLVWFIKGEPVRSFGPEHAVLGNGTRVFDRRTRGEWVNPYANGGKR